MPQNGRKDIGMLNFISWNSQILGINKNKYIYTPSWRVYCCKGVKHVEMNFRCEGVRNSRTQWLRSERIRRLMEVKDDIMVRMSQRVLT